MGNSKVMQQFASYDEWIADQPLAEHTVRVYRRLAKQYCEFVADNFSDGTLDDKTKRDEAVRAFKKYLIEERDAKPNSVNLALASVDHFFRYLGFDSPKVGREVVEQSAPQILTADELEKFHKVVDESSVRDQAIALLLLNTGIRLGECAELNIQDVTMAGNRGTIRVHSGDESREIPLNSVARNALKAWLSERDRLVLDEGLPADEPALFTSRLKLRLSPRSVDLVIRGIGREAGIPLSAHRLRHTCLSRLVKSGHDLVLVSEIAGHRRLETTRRYSDPSEADRAVAMESLSSL